MDQQQEITDLRDAIRLIIGRDCNMPWQEVGQSEVDAYLMTIRRFKAEKLERLRPDRPLLQGQHGNVYVDE